MPTTTISAYNAGDLFTCQALAGNARLALEVHRISQGTIHLHNPQDLEHSLTGLSRPAKRIRDNNLLSLLRSDVVVCNFEGLEIDSGTVNESAVASSVGMPRVLFRSDVRRPILPALGPEDTGRLSVDGLVDDAVQCELESGWNLMMKDYPRTVLAEYPAFFRYERLLRGLMNNEGQPDGARSLELACEAANKVLAEISDLLMRSIRAVVDRPGVFSSADEAIEAYRRVADYAMLETHDGQPAHDALTAVAEGKLLKGTL